MEEYETGLGDHKPSKWRWFWAAVVVVALMMLAWAAFG